MKQGAGNSILVAPVTRVFSRLYKQLPFVFLIALSRSVHIDEAITRPSELMVVIDELFCSRADLLLYTWTSQLVGRATCYIIYKFSRAFH